jgi:hypothetical protein
MILHPGKLLWQGPQNPAWAPTGPTQPYALGGVATSSVSTVITTTAQLWAGDTIVVAASSTNPNCQLTAVSDGTNGAYALNALAAGTSFAISYAYVINAATLAAGSSINVTWAATDTHGALACGIPKATAIDQATGLGTSGSNSFAGAVVTGTLAQAKEIALLTVSAAAGVNPGVYTMPGYAQFGQTPGLGPLTNFWLQTASTTAINGDGSWTGAAGASERLMMLEIP